MTTRGRPTKLTPDIQVKIVESLKLGNYIETAAAIAGVNKTSVYEWLKRGARELERVENTPNSKVKKKEEPYVNFSNAVQKAQAEAETRDLLIIAQASKNDWKASAWRLERRFPQKWGRREHVEADIKQETTNTNREELVIEQKLFSDPESMELLKELYRRQSALD